MFAALSLYYTGSGRRAYVLDALKDARAVPVYLDPGSLVEILAGDPDPATRESLIQLAGDRNSPGAPEAVSGLVVRRDSKEILRLADAETAAASPAPEEYRRALIDAVTRLHIREAIPFLLREFKEGLSDEGAKAMDRIREYHERLAKFEGWSKGDEAGRRDLTALLHDEDPEIRRAAVLSVAAMGDTEALPTLVKIAKEDKDPRVRAAVFEAVERISKEAAKRPPNPATPKDPAMDGE